MSETKWTNETVQRVLRREVVKVYADHCAANAISRSLGMPETPLGVDPLSHGA